MGVEEKQKIKLECNTILLRWKRKVNCGKGYHVFNGLFLYIYISKLHCTLHNETETHPHRNVSNCIQIITIRDISPKDINFNLKKGKHVLRADLYNYL